MQRATVLSDCLAGPQSVGLAGLCGQVDANLDERVDLLDVAAFWSDFGVGLSNDGCSCLLPVGDGSVPFANVGATTDGPDEPEACTFFDNSRVEADVWFCYTASCSVEAVVGLCGSDYDTKVAVYEGCDCPNELPIACSDDDCGPTGGPQSRMTFPAVAGTQYLIRIGGYLGAQGQGLLNVRCGGDPCFGATGSCLEAHATAGCDDPTCCSETCTLDPFCCDVAWDQFCAPEAEGLCTGHFDACSASAESCGGTHLDPGCSPVDCCDAVCQQDPYCCLVEWDSTCVTHASDTCQIACGPGSGSCFLSNGSPGCDAVDCCLTVCDVDSVCCDTVWDDICVQEAVELCR